MVWFLILVSTTIVLFDELEKRLEKMVNIGLNDTKVAGDLKVWKKHHSLACQLVTCINNSFGLNLVIAFSHGFITFVANFYRFISGLPIHGIAPSLPFIFIFIQQAVFLSIFIIASYRLQSWVIIGYTIFLSIIIGFYAHY